MSVSVATHPWRASGPWALGALAAGALAGALALDPSVQRAAVRSCVAVALAVAVAVIVRRPAAGVFALVAAAPLVDAAAFSAGGVKATLFGVALAASVAGWAIEAWRRPATAPAVRLGPLGWALAAPFLAGLWSLPLSLNAPKTAVYSLRLLGLWLFAAFIVAHVRDERRLRQVLALVVALGVVLTVVAALQCVFPEAALGRPPAEAIGTGKPLRPSAFYLDPNFLAGYLSAACLAALGALTGARRAGPAVWWLAGAAACAGGAALTYSRSGLLGLGAGLLVVVAGAPRGRRLPLALALALAVVLAVSLAPATLADRIAGLADPLGEGSLATRYLMVGSTAEMIGDYWGTGTGLAAYDRAYPAYRRVGSLHRILRPHQLPLAMWAEMGVAGLLAEAALLGAALWAVVRRVRLGWSPLDTAVAAALAALVVQTFFQYYLYFEPLWLFAALLAAAPYRAAWEGSAARA